MYCSSLEKRAENKTSQAEVKRKEVEREKKKKRKERKKVLGPKSNWLGGIGDKMQIEHLLGILAQNLVVVLSLLRAIAEITGDKNEVDESTKNNFDSNKRKKKYSPQRRRKRRRKKIISTSQPSSRS